MAHLFSHNSRGQKSEIKVPTGLGSSEASFLNRQILSLHLLLTWSFLGSSLPGLFL